MSDDEQKFPEAAAQARAQAKPEEPRSILSQLRELKTAVAEGLLTDEEAGAMKQTLLRGSAPAAPVDDDKSSLAKYFRDAELRTHQVWRRDFEKFNTIKSTWLATSLETKRAMFVDKAKARNLTPTEAMLSIYLLYGGEAELEFLRSLVVSSSGSLRLMMHNMYVASSCDPSFLHSFGDQVIKLSEPLFPHTADFTALNALLLDEAESGGGSSGRRFFKAADEEDPLGGGPTHFYLQTDQEGQHFTDMTQVEQSVGALQRQMGNVVASLDKVMGRANAKTWYPRKNKQNNTQFPSQAQAQATPPGYVQYNTQGYQIQPTQQQFQQQFSQPSITGRGNQTGAADPLQVPTVPATTKHR
jgi:hypothetical protein